MALPLDQHTLKELRDLGFVVVVWTPEELGDADPDHLEDLVIERGSDYLSTFKES